MEVLTPERKRGLAAMNGALALIVVLLTTQVWLLSATLDAYLSGHRDAVIPGCIVSGLLFLGCGGLYRFVVRLERHARRDDGPA